MNKNVSFVAVLLLATSFLSCKKSDNQRLFDSLSATITSSGTTTNFNASSVDDQQEPNLSSYPGTYRIQLTANGSNGEYITISFVYPDAVPSTYDITTPLNDSNAICAYHKAGATSDDVAVSGSITGDTYVPNPLNSSEHKLSGTFDFTTASGAHITGTYSVII
jgi:hypothetical protein